MTTPRPLRADSGKGPGRRAPHHVRHRSERCVARFVDATVRVVDDALRLVHGDVVVTVVEGMLTPWWNGPHADRIHALLGRRSAGPQSGSGSAA